MKRAVPHWTGVSHKFFLLMRVLCQRDCDASACGKHELGSNPQHSFLVIGPFQQPRPRSDAQRRENCIHAGQCARAAARGDYPLMIEGLLAANGLCVYCRSTISSEIHLF